jgi:cyclase
VAFRCFDGWSADEIVVLDVSRNLNERERIYDALRAISEDAACPLTAGGWVTSIDEAERLFNLGADKIIINTLLYDDPYAVKRMAVKYGTQAIVASIDIRGRVWYVNRGADEAGSLRDAVNAATEGWAGEIFLTDIDREGTNRGYNLEVITSVSEMVNVPLVVFGGVSKFEHLWNGLQAGADAVALANLLHYSEGSVRKAKEYLKKHGANVR